MAVVTFEDNNYVKDGDLFVCKLLTDQNNIMFYRCLYIDNNTDHDKEDDRLLVFNFENHYPKDNILIPCGVGQVNKIKVIEEIKKRWTCEIEIEFIKNDNLLIKLSKK